MKTDLFKKINWRKLLSRLAVGAAAVSLGAFLILWDMGIITLPFLTPRDRREPQKNTVTEENRGTTETQETETATFVDWGAFAEDAIAALYSFSAVENGASLVTALPYQSDSMTIAKQPLPDGSYTASMGFLTRDDGSYSVLFTVPDLQEVMDPVGYKLTSYRDSGGFSVFVKEDTSEYFRFDPETRTFVPSDFDPVQHSRGINFPLPAEYGKSDEDKTLIYENGLYGYTGKYLDGRRTRSFTVEPSYPTAFAYSEGFAVMADAQGKITIRNERGEEVFTELSLILPDKTEEESLGFYYFDGGVLRVIIAGYDAEGNLTSRRESLINTKGQEVSLPSGYSVVSLHEGMLLVTDGEHYGFLSSGGAWIANPIYSAASPFMEGLAVVTDEEGRMGVIDTEGKTVLACAFDLVSDFSNGNALCYSRYTGWHLLTKLDGSFSDAETEQPEAPYYTKITITRGPQNTFDYEPDEIIELPSVLSTPSRTTHPENTTSQQIK